MSGATLGWATLGGLTSWAAHLVLSYLVIAALCGEELRGAERIDATVVLVIVTVAALVAAASASLLAYGAWRYGTGMVRTIGFGGFLLDLLGVVAILTAGVIPGFVRPCGGG